MLPLTPRRMRFPTKRRSGSGVSMDYSSPSFSDGFTESST